MFITHTQTSIGYVNNYKKTLSIKNLESSCSVCGIKLETKWITLHKIEVVKISSFLLNKYAVHNF